VGAEELLSEVVPNLLQVTSYRQLVGPGALPVELVVRFLALLELYKQSLIDLEQPEPFDDIDVTWTGQPGQAVAYVEERAT
jgi:segregation and condensation protein A